MPRSLGSLKKMTYTTAHVRMPERSIINLKNASSEITGHITVPDEGAAGVIACQGGNMSGWSLYLTPDGRAAYHYNCFGQYLTTVMSPRPLGVGEHTICARYDHDGGHGAGGEVALLVDGEVVDEGRIERTVPNVFSMSGETFDVGIDTGAPVGDYPHEFPFSGIIHGVTLERLSEPDGATRAAMRAGEAAARLAAE